MLKDTSMRNAKDNYLTDKTIHFEPIKETKIRNKSGDFCHNLPPLIDEFQEFKFADNLRPTLKEKHMIEKDPKHIEKKKIIAKKKQKSREEKFNDGQITKKYPASSYDVTVTVDDLDDNKSKKTIVTQAT